MKSAKTVFTLLLLAALTVLINAQSPPNSAAPAFKTAATVTSTPHHHHPYSGFTALLSPSLFSIWPLLLTNYRLSSPSHCCHRDSRRQYVVTLLMSLV